MMVVINDPTKPILLIKKNIVIKLITVDKIVILMYSLFLLKENISCFKAKEIPIKIGINNPALNNKTKLVLVFISILK
jgi:hypothetical protein